MLNTDESSREHCVIISTVLANPWRTMAYDIMGDKICISKRGSFTWESSNKVPLRSVSGDPWGKYVVPVNQFRNLAEEGFL